MKAIDELKQNYFKSVKKRRIKKAAENEIATRIHDVVHHSIICFTGTTEGTCLELQIHFAPEPERHCGVTYARGLPISVTPSFHFLGQQNCTTALAKHHWKANNPYFDAVGGGGGAVNGIKKENDI